MPGAAAGACSPTPSPSSRCRNTPRRTGRAPSGRSTRCCSIRATASSPRCSRSRRRVGSSAATVPCTSSTSWPVHITRVELFELTIPFVEPFIISGGRIDARRSLVVALHDDAGHVGYGESPAFGLPFYSEETLAGARDLIARVLLPRIAGQEFDAPEAVDAVVRAGVRGNPFARAGIETAAWDLEAHHRGVGLGQLVALRLGVPAAASVPCGVAPGIPQDRQPGTLTRSGAAARQQGYRRGKSKVVHRLDEVPVAAARAAMRP